MLDGIRIILFAGIGEGGKEFQHKSGLEFFSCLVERGQCLLGLIQAHLHIRQVIIGLLKIVAQQQGLTKEIGRFRQFLLIEREITKEIIGLGVGRIVLHDRLQLFHCLLRILPAQNRVSASFARTSSRTACRSP